MRVQTFYNQKPSLLMLGGVLCVLAAPVAQGSVLPQLMPINLSQSENPVELLPQSSLFVTQPPQHPDAGRSLTFTDIMGRAFNRDDFNALYGAGAFSSCETSSRIPSFFEKNYSNFVHSCLDEMRGRSAISFDERFQADPNNQGVVVAPLGGRMQWTSIRQGARERLLRRSINDLAQRNKTLADIIQGRISFDFGLGTFWKTSTANARTKNNTPRLRYVVEVESSEQKSQNKKQPMVASIGKLPAGSVQKAASWLSQKPARARRILKEVFDSSETASASSASASPPLAAAENSPHDDSTLSSLKYLSSLAGLTDLPFTKMNMRAERRVVEGQNQFALRATESQDLFFAEIPNAAHASSGNLVWGYKIPWQRHAINIRVDESSQERTTSYSYKIDDSNKSDLSFNHKSRAVSAGFVISF